MHTDVLIAGGGIGGLAAGLACSRAGCHVRLYERADTFAEVGAGIQMGPNVTRVLQGWDLDAALRQVAAFPDRLQVRNALSGAELGVLPLGASMVQRYGTPYATIHRADLQQVLLQALQQREAVWLHTGKTVNRYVETNGAVGLSLSDGLDVEGDALIAADGLWSRIRAQLLADGPPRVAGHLAYRALLRQADLPAALRSQQVTAWLGPKLHVVAYPVRGGDWLNVVAIVHGHVPGGLEDWDHGANAADLQAALAPTCADLRDLITAVPAWRLWVLCDRPPVGSVDQMARGHVALLGDAAHPMRPYLAQGAGMAIEDAAELGRQVALVDGVLDVPTLLQRYALNRWQRNARVQARSIRNGEIFHLEGPMAWARNASLRLLGERLLDVPWLYRGG
ncbi:MAG: FAD-dependent monooxygenase [Hylemonella sp.]|uniref:FAD-dependent monooxygenase n=1 Tax=Hylemonella sp. TaxID=2066020 RepID=UPI0022BD54AD|nr:FAD-dependent monooxygenase [Hylemonella sp.]MCZ8251998.1 FAD-dependent monooxygenase [Hylemonella sp.]